MSTLQRLTDRGLARPPRWLPGNVQYETIMGSVAYGVSSDTSDVDIYGWAVPPRDDVFPHLRGEIQGFGREAKRFEVYQEHHVHDRDSLGGHGRTYDLTIFGIVKLFALAMENNPNIIDALFTPAHCVLHSTRVGNLVRENRRLFLHKGAWPKFKEYGEAFLAGPVAFNWLATACRLPGSGLPVVLTYRFLGARFQIPKGRLWNLEIVTKGLRVSDDTVRRGLAAAERA